MLPTLTVDDIPRDIPEVSIFNYNKNKTIYFNPRKTNGLVHFLAYFRVPFVPDLGIPFIPTFSGAVTKLGARGMNHEQLAEKIELYTGGIFVTLNIIPDVSDMSKYEIGLTLSSSCLERNFAKMMDLVDAVVTEYNLDANNAYLRSLLEQDALAFSNALTDDAPHFARTSSAKKLSDALVMKIYI